MAKRHGRPGIDDRDDANGRPVTGAEGGGRAADVEPGKSADRVGRGSPADRSRPRVREGPSTERPSSPSWDLTNVRIRREGKARFDAFRFRVSSEDRILPHWEAFERLLDVAEGVRRERGGLVGGLTSSPRGRDFRQRALAVRVLRASAGVGTDSSRTGGVWDGPTRPTVVAGAWSVFLGSWREQDSNGHFSVGALRAACGRAPAPALARCAREATAPFGRGPPAARCARRSGRSLRSRRNHTAPAGAVSLALSGEKAPAERTVLVR